MLVITSDNLPPFIEIEEVLGQFTVNHPVPLKRNLITSILDRNRNDLQEGHDAIIQTARLAKGESGQQANLAYGIRVSTCVVEDQSGPMLIMTYTGTSAIMRQVDIE